jgi:carboxyl-terminal processing protease
MSFVPKNISTPPVVKQRRRSNWGLGFFLAFLFALGAFMSGLQIGRGVFVEASLQPASVFSFFSGNKEAESSEGTRPELTEFWKVWDLLEEKFVVSSSTNGLTDEQRIQGAIDGLVDAYDDPYTVYMPPAEAEKFSEDISGNFSGVGMEVGLRDKMITVISPLPDTPAEQAGMIAGDVIVKIDGVSTEDMSIDQAVNLIRGERGTVVELQVYREGATEFQTISITRDTINIPTVRTEQIDGTFIIALYSFNAIAEAEVGKALQEYLESDAKTLVLDLRGNPGGFLQSAVSIASYFLPAGKVVVSEEFGEGEEKEVFRSRGRVIQNFTPKNLVVLVDGGSASASEILAGALKDHGVATVMGKQTFGKGSVQELVNLDGGGSLKVTVARWLTPNGTSISEGGLAPDIVINRSIEDRQAEIDPQKDAAVRFLSGETVVSEVEGVATESDSAGE